MFCSRCGAGLHESAKFCPSCGLDLAAATPLAPGTVGAKGHQASDTDIVKDALHEEYEIIEELGRGGMAIVFRAKERQLEREVALKVLPFSLAFDNEFVERFQREARTAARLEHPNIIPIYRVGRSGRVIYFVMKYLRGKSLSDVIEDGGPLPASEIRRILNLTAGALGYAHQNGIVHRDIKPDNIMFDELGNPVVTDFGIAKAASGTKLTGTGMSIGTPHYMSPEQARAQALDGRSDIYSLGVVAYQCLTGKVPFDGEDSFSIGYKHIMEPLPTPPMKAADQRDLFEIIRRMLAKAPDERFQSASELAAALEGGPSPVSSAATVQLRVGNLTAARAGVGRAAISATPTTPTTPIPRTDPRGSVKAEREREKKSGVLAGMLMVLLFGGGGAGGYYYYNYIYRPGLVAKGSAPAATNSVADSALTHQADSTLLASQTAATTDSATTDSTATAVPPPKDSASAAAPAGAAPVPAHTGSLRLDGVPPGARVKVDGEFEAANPVTLDPGSHKIEVMAIGFDNFMQTTNVRRADQTVVTVKMVRSTTPPEALLPTPQPRRPPPDPRTPVTSCDVPGDSYNRDGSCFDQRPVPTVAPLVPLPAGIDGIPSPAVLLVKVGADGRPASVSIKAPSTNPQFTLEAVKFARTILYNPARKRGQAVPAYFEQMFRPGPRQ